MLSYEDFSENCRHALKRIATACNSCGRAAETVKLLPVTKTHSSDAVLFAAKFGFGAVGENRVHEAAEKRPKSPPHLRWELIGHLQSNKVKQAIATFDRIQTVDSIELAKRIDRLAGESEKIMPILLQANAGADPAKFGLVDFDSVQKLANELMPLTNLRLDGLMTIPALDSDFNIARRAFDTLREWRDRLETHLGQKLPELSMGMSGDLEVAIAAGSTMVRVGTALFGQRPSMASVA